MMKNPIPYRRIFSALPSYAGGKRRLVQPIFNTLSKILPTSEWSQATFIDGFLGGGSISLFAKAQGFGQVISNDWSHRSQIISRALLGNDRVQLLPQDILALATHSASGPSFIEETFSGSVFSQRHAQALDQALGYLSTVQGDTKRALIQLLIWHLVPDFVAFGTSIGTSNRPFAEVLDGHADWQNLNPKRLSDGSFEKLLKPVWSSLEAKRRTINRGIFPGMKPVQCHRQDIFDLVPAVTGDILYLDPPYPDTLSYEKSNRVLDTVLLGAMPEKSESSPFTDSITPLYELLLQARHIPIWLISLNNKVVDLETLQAEVQRVAPDRTLQGWAKAYKHLPHVSKTTNNQELLVAAVSTKGVTQ